MKHYYYHDLLSRKHLFSLKNKYIRPSNS